MLRLAARRFLPNASRRNFAMIREPGPVGLSAGSNPRETLSKLYKNTLEELKDFPEEASYRVNVEKITNYRLGVVSENEDVKKIEAALGVGQIQEVIEQAENELELIPHMAEWKPWEMQPGQKPAVINIID